MNTHILTVSNNLSDVSMSDIFICQGDHKQDTLKFSLTGVTVVDKVYLEFALPKGDSFVSERILPDNNGNYSYVLQENISRFYGDVYLQIFVVFNNGATKRTHLNKENKIIITQSIMATEGVEHEFKNIAYESLKLLEETNNVVDSIKYDYNSGAFKGEKGDSGAKGDNGITPELSINVVSLAEGETATVTKSGNASNPIFTFGIPKGDKGDRGLQGVQGVKGEKGESGANGERGIGIFKANKAVSTTSDSIYIKDTNYGDIKPIINDTIMDSVGNVFNVTDYSDGSVNLRKVKVTYVNNIRGASGANGTAGKDGKRGAVWIQAHLNSFSNYVALDDLSLREVAVNDICLFRNGDVGIVTKLIEPSQDTQYQKEGVLLGQKVSVKGVKGDTGDRGLQGVQGEKGDGLNIIGTVDSVSELPSAESVVPGTHYYVGVDIPRNIYSCDGTKWTNQGKLISGGASTTYNDYFSITNFDDGQTSNIINNIINVSLIEINIATSENTWSFMGTGTTLSFYNEGYTLYFDCNVSLVNNDDLSSAVGVFRIKYTKDGVLSLNLSNCAIGSLDGQIIDFEQLINYSVSSCIIYN